MKPVSTFTEPLRIDLSEEEILADLLYPARPDFGAGHRTVWARRNGRGVAAQTSGTRAKAPGRAAPPRWDPLNGAAAAVESALEHAERSPETTRTRLLTWQDPLPSALAGAELAGIEYMRAVLAGELPPPPIAVTLRMAVVEVGEGRAVFAGEPGEEHYNPIGVVHGGYAATLLDSAIGCAVHTTLPAGVGYTTLTLEAKFVRPIGRDTGAVRCEASVLHRGRRQATAEARLIDGGGRLLAHGTGTCMILGG